MVLKIGLFLFSGFGIKYNPDISLTGFLSGHFYKLGSHKHIVIKNASLIPDNRVSAWVTS